PALAKFKDPTAAEAILAAMDADLKAHDAKPADDLHDYRRQEIEDGYLTAIVDLGDKRIAGEAAKRAAAANTLRMRRKWAYAAHWLGDVEPFEKLADDFRLGKIVLPANDRPRTNDDDQPGNVELTGIIRFLVSVGTPTCDRALSALADAKHPLNEVVARRILTAQGRGPDEGPWFAHPFCLRILRKALDNVKPTGSNYRIEKDRLGR